MLLKEKFRKKKSVSWKAVTPKKPLQTSYEDEVQKPRHFW